MTGTVVGSGMLILLLVLAGLYSLHPAARATRISTVWARVNNNRHASLPTIAAGPHKSISFS
ncbi:hypothetical protein LY78DRAFT_664486 [Colletotrichum sublineola]|nr:hypothetical protein LY78DRAFT_664486 [Colletotrichum sublineola]